MLTAALAACSVRVAWSWEPTTNFKQVPGAHRRRGLGGGVLARALGDTSDPTEAGVVDFSTKASIEDGGSSEAMPAKVAADDGVVSLRSL